MSRDRELKPAGESLAVNFVFIVLKLVYTAVTLSLQYFRKLYDGSTSIIPLINPFPIFKALVAPLNVARNLFSIPKSSFSSSPVKLDICLFNSEVSYYCQFSSKS